MSIVRARFFSKSFFCSSSIAFSRMSRLSGTGWRHINNQLEIVFSALIDLFRQLMVAFNSSLKNKITIVRYGMYCSWLQDSVM